jgi:hypothetical protein
MQIQSDFGRFLLRILVASVEVSQTTNFSSRSPPRDPYRSRSYSQGRDQIAVYYQAADSAGDQNRAACVKSKQDRRARHQNTNHPEPYTSPGNIDSSIERPAAGILLISRAVAPPTPRAYQSAPWAAGITPPLATHTARSAGMPAEPEGSDRHHKPMRNG